MTNLNPSPNPVDPFHDDVGNMVGRLIHKQDNAIDAAILEIVSMTMEEAITNKDRIELRQWPNRQLDVYLDGVIKGSISLTISRI